MSFARRSLQVVAVVCTLIVGVASMVAIVTQTTWFKEWLRGFVVRQAGNYLNGAVSIDRLGGNLFFGVELEGVRLTMDGKPVIGIQDVGLDYNAFTLVSGGVVLDDIRLNRPVVHLARNGNDWNLARLIKVRTPDPDEPKTQPTVEIREIGVSDGTLYLEGDPVGTSGVDVPSRVERLDASIGVTSNEDVLEVRVGHVSLRAAEPAIGINALSGVVRRTRDAVTIDDLSLRTEESSLRVDGRVSGIESATPVLQIKASADKIALEEIGRIVTGLRGLGLQPALEVTADGPMDRLQVALNVREETVGQVRGDLTVDAAMPGRRVAGTVAVEHLNIEPIVARGAKAAGSAPAPGGQPLRSDITASGRIDLALPEGRLPLSGTYELRAPDVRVAGYAASDVTAAGRVDGDVVQLRAAATAYGARATAEGTAKTGEALAIDMRGRVEHVDLRNFPAALDLPRAATDIQLDYQVTGRGNVYSGEVRLDRSTLAEATIESGTTAHFTVGQGAPEYTLTGAVRGLDLQQVGRSFGVDALTADRFRTTLNVTGIDVKGTGGGRFPLRATAAGTVRESTLFGGQVPELSFAADVADGDAHVTAQGRFAEFDPAVAAGDSRYEGRVGGALNVDATVQDYASGVTADSVAASGRIDLDPSTIAGLTIDRTTLNGRYAARQGQIDELTIAGPDINVSGQGTLALDEAGQSNLTLHAESASLERLGALAGQSLKGSVAIDATVTGNGRQLTAQGTVKGGNVGQGDNGALTLNTDFTVGIPDLTPAAATVKATSQATFVQVGGQTLTELTADTTYHDSMLDFDALARERMRELQVRGSVRFEPEQQEITLANLGLRAEAIQWQLAAGSSPTIRYGGGRIAVERLQLVSGDQRIEAEGALGTPADSLRVRAENLDVAQLDRLALADQRLAGRLSAEATIAGETSAPQVQADFTLASGAFRDFKFDSLGGNVQYASTGLNLDVRLQQSPTAWLTAKGFAPPTLLRPSPPELAGMHVDPAPGEAIDIQVESSEIDLGLIQGFTSAVTNVAGSLQANLKVTGAGVDPHLDGAIDIKGGAFEVPELGTSYTGLDTRIELQPEQVVIREFKVLDDHGSALTVGGTLAVHARNVGAVNIGIDAQQFSVIDNELGDVKLNTQMRVTGEVRKPRVEGSIEVQDGRIEVARVLELATARPYESAGGDASTQTREERVRAQVGQTGAGQTLVRDDRPLKDAVNDSLKGGGANGTSGQPAEGAAAEAATDTAAEAAPEPSLFDNLELKVALAVPSNLVLRGNDIRPANAAVAVGDMNVTVGGALEIQKDAGSPLRIVGEVNTVRGNYTFQGRRFEILRDGRIRFSGGDAIDPVLDLQARREISGVEAIIHVRGSVREPELSFSSNPPLEEADILSLIVFNQSINELGEGQQVSLAQRAGALAGGYLASGLSRSLGNALDVDELEIQAQGDNGSGPSLTVGEQVGEKLFVRLRQAFGNAQSTELILEYQIAEFLRLQGAAAEGSVQRSSFRRVERGGLDLIFFFSY